MKNVCKRVIGMLKGVLVLMMMMQCNSIVPSQMDLKIGIDRECAHQNNSIIEMECIG